VNDLERYLEVIVEPTFAEFTSKPNSRLAFLTCVAIFHAVDRAAYPNKPAKLRQAWCRESLDFKLVEIVAHHFKHVKSSDEKITGRPGLPVARLFRFNEEGDEMELRNFWYVMRDAISFLRRKVADLDSAAEPSAAMSST